MEAPSNSLPQAEEITNASAIIADQTEAFTKFRSVTNRLKRHRLGIALGATVASLGFGVAVNPAGKVLHNIEQEAPWVVPTEIALDAALVAGATMMVTSAYGKVSGNPWKAKTFLKELPEHANTSTLFKTGFAVTTVAGVAWGGVAAGAIATCLPPESWGTLAWPVADMAGTVVLRREIWKGMQQAAQQEAQPD